MKKSLRDWERVCAIFFLLVFLGGCTFDVYVRPTPILDTTKKINLKIGLFIDESKLPPYHSQSGFCLMGGTWNIHTGVALRMGAEQTFKTLFTDVEILKDVSEFKNKSLALLITPKIKRFHVSQSIQAELFLHCILVDQVGKIVYDHTIPVKGSSEGGLVFIFGVWAGKEALSKTSTDAFNRAFALLADDIIKKVNFSPYLEK